jgi:hypothetical protein
MEQSPSWEADSSSASQEISHKTVVFHLYLEHLSQHFIQFQWIHAVITLVGL